MKDISDSRAGFEKWCDNSKLDSRDDLDIAWKSWQAALSNIAWREEVLNSPAMVGRTKFGKGVKCRLVIDRAKREYQHHQNPTEHCNPDYGLLSRVIGSIGTSEDELDKIDAAQSRAGVVTENKRMREFIAGLPKASECAPFLASLDKECQHGT